MRLVSALCPTCRQIPPSALPCWLPRCCLLQSACPVCLGACWELEGEVARETSACVRAYLCVSESERERESRTGNQRTRAHTRALSVSTDFYSLRTNCRPPQRAQKAAIRTRKVAQFFFFGGGWCCVAARAAPRRIHWPEQDRGSPRRTSAYPEGPWRIKGFPLLSFASDTLFLFSRLSFLVRTGMRRQL